MTTMAQVHAALAAGHRPYIWTSRCPLCGERGWVDVCTGAHRACVAASDTPIYDVLRTESRWSTIRGES